MREYDSAVAPQSTNEGRWQLYRLLAEPTRLQVLALAAAEELSVGELSELLGQSQPNVSRYVAPLRDAGLVRTRRQGKRVLVSTIHAAAQDAVVADALVAGRSLCELDGSLNRIAAIIASRDANAREFFERSGNTPGSLQLANELPGYGVAMSSLLPRRQLAVDVGTGDGALIDLLAPLYAFVVAVDRSAAQLARAQQRIDARGYENVTLVQDRAGGEALQAAVGKGADLVMASRFLHHAPLPRDAISKLAALVGPGGHLIVIDYGHHDDEALREQQADVWLGFEPSELESFALDAGLVAPTVRRIPPGFVRNPIDGHLPWLALDARRPE